MNRPIPPYLRLHNEEDPAGAAAHSALPSALDALCRNFEEATGWRISSQPESTPAAQPADAEATATWSADIPLGDGSRQHWELASSDTTDPLLSLDNASKLADSLALLLSDRGRLEQELASREAELAAGVPLVHRPDGGRHLATRLEAALKGGAEALGCQAAALFLLDADTTILKLRSCWGLPLARLAEPPRPLSGALADLEALLGHAVVLSDTQLFEHWNPPERSFGSAVCVPVSSPTVPLGTVWFFCDQPRDFNDAETNIAEVVAGRLAADLEREMLMVHQRQESRSARELEAADTWHRSHLPAIAPLVEGYELAGSCRSAEYPCGDFYDWWMLPNGELAIAVGAPQETGLLATLCGSQLRGLLRAESRHETIPHDVLAACGNMLWTMSDGDQTAGLGYATLEVESGLIRLAAAGEIAMLRLNEARCERLGSRELMLGADPEPRYSSLGLALDPGETLLLVSENLLEAVDATGRSLGTSGIWAASRAATDRSARSLLESIAVWLERHVGGPPLECCTLLALRRLPEPVNRRQGPRDRRKPR